MLSSQHRLRHKMDIDRVLKSKTGVFDAACGIKYVKTDRTVSRFAIVVGGKVSKNATDRNKVRRHYREILRSLLLKVRPGFDVVLLTSKSALELDFVQKQEKLIRVLQKAKLL